MLSSQRQLIKRGAARALVYPARSRRFHMAARRWVERRSFNIALASAGLLAVLYCTLSRTVTILLDSPLDRDAVRLSTRRLALPPDSVSTRAFLTLLMGQNGALQLQNKLGIYLLLEQEVTERLRRFEESYNVNRGKGVVRYDVCQLPSNSTIEDDRLEKIVQVPVVTQNNIKTTSDWLFWGVYDGHSGWGTLAKLRDHLIEYVVLELGTVYKPLNDTNVRTIPLLETIDRAIKTGFMRLDDDLVTKNVEKLLLNPSKAQAAELLMPALSGLCGLLSFYDLQLRNLKVAVTGDLRAILGSCRDGQWTVQQLLVDQTGLNPYEAARILAEHPNEPNAIRNGRILGSLEPLRAFGDARYKWGSELQKVVLNTFFGRPPPANLKTPPYVTAEPVVTTTKVNPDNRDFLVMGTDGLFELLLNEEIVGLVVKWMEKEQMILKKTTLRSYFSSSQNKLPEVVDALKDPKLSKKPFRRGADAGYFLEDRNVATHLVRNALGNGGSKEHCAMLVSIPSPLSRRYRDDLTATVVFFGNEGEANDEGRLEVNPTGTSSSAKPKL